MDNEFSNHLKCALEKHEVTFEKVPPHIHRRNAAERAICTFKNHFLAGLASMDPTFPITQWDRLLEQAELTLNLLRSSRVNQKLSAYTYLFGNFDFNKTPLAPPGTKVAVHIKPEKRTSWGYHVELGYYIGPAMEHYRCFKCYIPKTGGIRVADTVKFLPHDKPFPQVTPEDQLFQALSDILQIIQKTDHSLPFLHFGDNAKNAIVQLATVLDNNTQNNLKNNTVSPSTPQILAQPVTTTTTPTKVKFNIPLSAMTPSTDNSDRQIIQEPRVQSNAQTRVEK